VKEVTRQIDMISSQARDKGGLGESRQLDLPCIPGADSRPPFTCGSATRKRIIKNFVRNYIQQNAGEEQLVHTLVKEQLNRLMKAWDQDIAEFSCSIGQNGCQNFLPDSLLEPFDKIKSSNVLKAVFTQVCDILSLLWLDILSKLL